MADIVRVVNKGSKPHKGMLDGKPYEIPANGEAIIDREAAAKDFGNWQARNLSTRPRERFRDKEVARILGLYGVHKGARIPARDPKTGGAVYDDDGVVKEVLSDQVASDYLPKVDIYEMDGTKCITVLDDPTGETLPLEGAAAGDVTKVVASQTEQLTQQQAQIAELREMLLETRGAIEAPKDSPNTAKRPQQKKPEVTAAQVSRD